jgi:putative chitinase
MMVTLDNIIAAGVKPEIARQWLAAIQVTCEKFQINTKQRIAAFLAQCAHESGGFTMLEENLNYSDATMAAVWPNRFAVIDPATKKPKKDEKGKNIPNSFAKALHRKPEAIANVVYSSRMGNGPTESGEGFLYRGRGLKQLTGKDNCTRCGAGIGADFVSHPELLLEPQYAALSAGWFWSSNKLDAFADKEDIEGMTKKINGGLIGIDDRKKRYKACIASFV